MFACNPRRPSFAAGRYIVACLLALFLPLLGCDWPGNSGGEPSKASASSGSHPPTAALESNEQTAPISASPALVEAAIRNAQERLAAALQQSSEYWSDSTRQEVQELSRRIDRVTRAQVEHGRTSNAPAERAKALGQRVADLNEAKLALLMRGSAESHRASGEIVAILEYLRDLAGKCGLEPSSIPENPWQLVEPWMRKRAAAELAQTRHELAKELGLAKGTRDKVLQRIDTELAQIRAAGKGPGADLVARFFHAAQRNGGEPPDEAWLQAREATRNQRALELEVQALKVSVARDPGDLRALSRLHELKAANSTQAFRSLAFARSLGQVPPKEAVLDLVRLRYVDPVQGAVAEGLLQHEWRQLEGVDATSNAAFLDWIFGFLDDSALAEVHACAAEAHHVAQLAELRTPAGLQSLPIDAAAAEADLAAIERAVASRGESASGVSTMAREAGDSLYQLQSLRSAADIPSEYLESVWQSLSKLEARRYGDPAGIKLREDIALRGYGSLVDALVRDATRLERAALQLRLELDSRKLLLERAKVLRRSIDAHSARSPTRNLTQRLDKLVTDLSPDNTPFLSPSDEVFLNPELVAPGTLPSPKLDPPALPVTERISPFSDPDILRMQKQFDQHVRTLESAFAEKVRASMAPLEGAAIGAKEEGFLREVETKLKLPKGTIRGIAKHAPRL